MRKGDEKIFTHIESSELPAGLFDRIIFAIKRERELRNSKRLAFEFLTLLIVSLMAVVESLPVAGIIIFTINIIFAVFTLRLFLYKKKLLVGYLLYDV